MANTSSTSSAMSSMTSLNRMTGLASGLDTESLVKAMAANSLKRYNRKASKLQTLQWKQEAYRNQISSLKSFSDKYLTTTSKFSIKLNSNMSKMVATASNSLVGVSTTGSAKAANYTISAATSASKTSITSSSSVINANVNLDFSKFNVDEVISKATSAFNDAKSTFDTAAMDYAGATLDMVDSMNGFDKGEFTQALQDKYDASSWDEAYSNLKDKLDNLNLDEDNSELYKNIASFATDMQKNISKDDLKSLNDTPVMEDLSTAKDALDTAKTDLEKAEKAMIAADKNANGLTTKISVTLDGKTKSIEVSASDSADAREKFITGLNSAFGLDQAESNKFALSEDGKLTYENEKNDGIHHTFSIGYNTNVGLSNNAYSDVSVNDTLGSIEFGSGLNFEENDKGVEVCNISINGKNFEFERNTSIATMLSTINSGDTGFKMSFSTFNQSFKLEAAETGANSIPELTGSLAQAIFGGEDVTKVDGTNSTITIAGEDGVEVKYTSASNVFAFDGTSIDVSKLGNFQAGVDGKEAITVSTTKDLSGTKDFIVNFINDYNTLISGIRSEMTTTRPKSNGSYYDPLTEEQRNEMSTEEINKWESEAKKGLLYQDSYLNNVLNDLQNTMSKAFGGITLADMGIKSADWTDYGKLTINEDKLDKFLMENGDKAADFFTNINDGLGKRLTDTVDKAISTTGKIGYLSGYAGVANTGTDKKNALFNEINSLQKVVTDLKSRYEKEMERYWARFTNLETYISRMNSQASIFASDY